MEYEMIMAEEVELRGVLKSQAGRDYLSSLPLIESQISSNTTLGILRSMCESIMRRVEKKFGCQMCLLTFGSLGRLEFVGSHSDLDPLIVYCKNNSSPSVDEIRAAIIKPIATKCPWLCMDDKKHIVRGNWAKIENIDLKYPVYDLQDLIQGEVQRTQQRQWQVLLESRPLYGRELYKDLHSSLLPTAIKTKNLLNGSGGGTIIDFQKLATSINDFFASFEDPNFLYKNAFKYWKTRFLREHYTFATSVAIVNGWYLQRHERDVGIQILKAPTMLKIMRARWFADKLEKAALQNEDLKNNLTQKLNYLIKKHGIDKSPLLLFGAHYQTEPAKLLHALLASVLSRFVLCWTRIYEKHVRATLSLIPPKNTNFDATFRATIKDNEARAIVDELIQLRNSYLRYMSASADAINDLQGILWEYSIPSWLHNVLTPFYK